MKKIRILLGAMAVCAISYTGYTAHEKANMSAEELAIMENVEALTRSESNGYTGCTYGSGYCSIYLNGRLVFNSNSHYPF